MKPYYDDGAVSIYLGDMREIVPSLSADAVVTDAPFGISDEAFDGGQRSGKRTGGDNVWAPPSEWDRFIDPEWCRLVSGAAPVVAWFGHWRKRTGIEGAMAHPLRCEIVWAKDCHVGPPCPAAMRDERIWIFSRDGIKPRRFETTVWDEPIIPTWARRWHKNEKPLKLMTRLISWLVAPGALIIDPFMGSGTTLRAAKDLGVRAVGIDIDEQHCANAVERLRQETLTFGGAA